VNSASSAPEKVTEGKGGGTYGMSLPLALRRGKDFCYSTKISQSKKE